MSTKKYHHDTEMLNDYSIYLNSATITPNQEMLYNKLEVKKIQSNEPKLYILQFNSPITKEQKQLVSQYGVEFGDYLPNFAFIIRTSSNVVQQLQWLSFIHRIVRYSAIFKLSKNLQDQSITTEKKVRLVTFAENQNNYTPKAQIIHRGKRSLTAKLKQNELLDYANDENIIMIEEVKEYNYE